MGYLSAELERKTREKRIITDVNFEVTYRCNLSCRICYLAHDHRNELTTGEIKNVLDQLARENCLFLTITGGEPLLRNDIFEILDYATDNGFAVSLKTNGTLLDNKLAQRFKEINLVRIDISLLGGNARVHDSITGISGSFEQALSAIKALKKANLKVHVMSVITRGHIEEMSKIEKLCEELGVDDHTFTSFIYPCSDGNSSPTEYRLTDHELHGYYKFLKVAPGCNQDIKTPDDVLLDCGSGRNVISITPEGKVVPCISLPIELGDLRQQTVHEILKSGKLNQIIDQTSLNNIKGCANCNDKLMCFRCPGLGYLESGHWGKPSPESCRHNKIIKTFYKDQGITPLFPGKNGV